MLGREASPICEAEVYDDEAFRRQLRDAAASLTVGSAWEPTSRITPLTQVPGADLRRALTTLDEGEEWLLEPRQVGANPRLWSPGIKLGVRPGSFFHRTECFGPVLGVMRAADLDEAIDLANDTPFGLTSGLHSLDAREVSALAGTHRGRQSLRQSSHHGRDRSSPAVRRLEALGLRTRREGGRPELRAPARTLASGQPALRVRRMPADPGRPAATLVEPGRRGRPSRAS